MSALRLNALVLTVLAGLLAPAAIAGDSVAPSSPLVVKIHADWCGTCRLLEPTWDELRARHGESVRFVVLDVTDRRSLAAATEEADRLGIRPVFERYKHRTGTIAVLSGASLEVVEVLKGETDPGSYEAAIARARS